MDAFESLIAMLLSQEGFWVRSSYKVELTKEEKTTIGRPSSPRWELDIVGYKGASNELRVVECKSYLDSYGVNFDSLTGKTEESRLYKLFNEHKLREVVFERLVKQLEATGACAPNPKVTLCLAAGRIKSGRHKEQLESYFAERAWLLLDDAWIRKALDRVSVGSYENDVVSVVAKLLLRK